MTKHDNSLPFPEVGGKITIPLVFSEEEEYTKSTIHNKAAKTMHDILETGEVNALEVFAKLKALSEYISACMDNVKVDALDMVEDYGDDCILFGMNVIKKRTPKQYSFSHYEDYVKKDDQIKSLVKELKELQTCMKKAVGSEGFIVKETGEIIPPAEISYEGDETIQVTIPSK